MNEMVQELLTSLITAVVLGLLPILGKFAISYVKKGTEILQSELDERKLGAFNVALDQVEKTVISVVTSLESTLVKEIKEKKEDDGKLTPEEGQEILGEAVKRVKKNASDDALDLLDSGSDSLEDLIKDLIESKVGALSEKK